MCPHPQSDPYPYPEHYIIRNPGGRIVPVIAVDQLPDWIQLGGVPREMSAHQAVGMTNLGVIDDNEDDESHIHNNNNGMIAAGSCCYEVQLRTDRIRAILRGEEEDEEENEENDNSRGTVDVGTSSVSSSSSLERGGRGDKEKGKKGKGKNRGIDATLPLDVTHYEGKRASSKRNFDAARRDKAATRYQQHQQQQVSLLDCDSGTGSAGRESPASSVPSYDEQEAAAKGHAVHQQPKNMAKQKQQQHQEGLQQQRTQIVAAEPMLSASRHNTDTLPEDLLRTSRNGDNNTNNEKQQQQVPIGPSIVQEEMPGEYRETYHHHHQQQYITRRTFNNQNQLRPFGVHGGSPDTLFCRHWCHHGACKWGWECRYQHRMPMDKEGLREVGLRDFPTWYLLLMGSGSGGGGFVPSSSAQHSPAAQDASTSSLSSAMTLPSNSDDRSALLMNKNDHNLSGRSVPRHNPAVALVEELGRSDSINNNNITTVTRQQQPHQRHSQHHHHPSPIELRVMQGRMSALLSGSTTMSNRQKLRQLKEMRELFQRSLSSNHNNNNHHHHTELAVPSGAGYQLHRSHHRQGRVATRADGLTSVDSTSPMEQGVRGNLGFLGENGPPEELESPVEIGRLTPVNSGEDADRDEAARSATVREGKLVDVD